MADLTPWAVREGLARQRRLRSIPTDPQDIMPALPRTPSYDEIAERLMWQTMARLKESRQLLEAAKQTLRKTWKGR